MGLIDLTIKHIKERRQNVLNGNVNCIPSPFKSFRNSFVGTEQECYFIITGTEFNPNSDIIILYVFPAYYRGNQEAKNCRITYLLR